MFLDTAFETFIETLVGKDQYNSIKEVNRKRMMEDFEYGIKRTFSEKSVQTYSVDLRGVKDDPENNVMDGTITITMYEYTHSRTTPAESFLNRDQLRAVFNQVTRRIENLVSDQIAEVSEKGLSVKVVTYKSNWLGNR